METLRKRNEEAFLVQNIMRKKGRKESVIDRLQGLNAGGQGIPLSLSSVVCRYEMRVSSGTFNPFFTARSAAHLLPMTYARDFTQVESAGTTPGGSDDKDLGHFSIAGLTFC